jgi:hypothetical protein
VRGVGSSVVPRDDIAGGFDGVGVWCVCGFEAEPADEVEYGEEVEDACECGVECSDFVDASDGSVVG